MSHGYQAAAGVNRTASVYINRTAFDKASAFTQRAQPQGFVVEDFLDSGGVVDLNQVEVFGSATGHVIRLIGGYLGEVYQRVAPGQASTGGGEHPGAGLIREAAGCLTGTKDNCGGTFVPGAAVKHR